MFDIQFRLKMKEMSKLLLCSMLIVACAFPVERTTAAPVADDSLTLWYNQPAQKWTEALPVGNGRVGRHDFRGREPGAAPA